MKEEHERELEEMQKELQKLKEKVLRAKKLSEKIELIAAKRESELMMRVKYIEIFHFFNL